MEGTYVYAKQIQFFCLLFNIFTLFLSSHWPLIRRKNYTIVTTPVMKCSWISISEHFFSNLVNTHISLIFGDKWQINCFSNKSESFYPKINKTTFEKHFLKLWLMVCLEIPVWDYNLFFSSTLEISIILSLKRHFKTKRYNSYFAYVSKREAQFLFVILVWSVELGRQTNCCHGRWEIVIKSGWLDVFVTCHLPENEYTKTEKWMIHSRMNIFCRQDIKLLEKRLKSLTRLKLKQKIHEFQKVE
jgi:hypothetical protein